MSEFYDLTQRMWDMAPADVGVPLEGDSNSVFSPGEQDRRLIRHFRDFEHTPEGILRALEENKGMLKDTCASVLLPGGLRSAMSNLYRAMGGYQDTLAALTPRDIAFPFLVFILVKSGYIMLIDVYQAVVGGPGHTSLIIAQWLAMLIKNGEIEFDQFQQIRLVCMLTSHRMNKGLGALVKILIQDGRYDDADDEMLRLIAQGEIFVRPMTRRLDDDRCVVLANHFLAGRDPINYAVWWDTLTWLVKCGIVQVDELELTPESKACVLVMDATGRVADSLLQRGELEILLHEVPIRGNRQLAWCVLQYQPVGFMDELCVMYPDLEGIFADQWHGVTSPLPDPGFTWQAESEMVDRELKQRLLFG